MNDPITRSTESESPAALVARLMGDALWLGSPDMTRIDYVNQAYEKLWGRTAEDVYGSPQVLEREFIPMTSTGSWRL